MNKPGQRFVISSHDEPPAHSAPAKEGNSTRRGFVMSAIATAALPAIDTAPAIAGNDADARLVELGRQFVVLSAEYDALERKIDDPDFPDGELATRGKALQELERKIKQTPAETVEGLLAKASVVRYWARREIQHGDDELSAESVALDLTENFFRIASRSPAIA